MVTVLDKGFVELIDTLGAEASIVDAARVSYGKDKMLSSDERDKKLISYLYKNGHTSPFEHVIFTFHVKAPIFVFRQWHRHRTWSFNEVSGRYTELDEDYYIPDTNKIGVQSKDNKQGRNLSIIHLTDEEELAAMSQVKVYIKHCDKAFKIYNSLIDAGWPKELARMALPFSTYSRMYATVDLHNLLHFLKLRLHEHAQYEIRVYAEAMLKLIAPIVPHTVSIFCDANNIPHPSSE